MHFGRYVTPPLSQTRSHTAYVAQDAPATGRPRIDVRATASLTSTSGQLTGQAMQRIDLLWLEDLLENVDAAAIVLSICAAPAATHLQGGSVCDQGNAYMAAIAAGLPRARAIAKGVGVGAGAASILAFVAGRALPEAPPAPAPAPQEPVPPPLPKPTRSSRLCRSASAASSATRIG
jgi:hypothetical protein